MKPGSDDFEDVRKLLAWKRHEQPPPGFFHDFSRHVVDRIESEQDSPAGSGWGRWLQGWDPRPILVGAYSVGVSGLLLLGIGLSQALTENPLEAKINSETLASRGWAAPLGRGYPLPMLAMPASESLSSPGAEDYLSAPPSFLFDTPRLRPQATPVNFKLDAQ